MANNFKSVQQTFTSANQTTDLVVCSVSAIIINKIQINVLPSGTGKFHLLFAKSGQSAVKLGTENWSSSADDQVYELIDKPVILENGDTLSGQTVSSNTTVQVTVHYMERTADVATIDIEELSNVSPTTPTDGQILVWNSAASEYVPTTSSSTDVTLAGAYDYLTLSGQEITLGQVDYNTDVSNTPSIPTSGVDFDPVGTDNSTDVTLAGSYDYLTLSGQQITLGQVDYTTDVSNTPTIPTSGVDFDPVGTDNSTDVTLAGTYNYLSLSGQEITLGQVDYTTDVSNTPSIPTSGVDFDPVGTDNSTDVTLAGSYDYLTLSGQQITIGQVDYTTDVSNTPAIPASGVDFDPVGTDNSTDVSVNFNATDVLRMQTGQILGSQDAGADKLVFWDDSEGKLTYADIGTNLTMTGTTLSASGGGGGGGNVTTSGTPDDNQLAVFTDSDTIEGDSSLTWDGSKLVVGGTAAVDRINVALGGISSAGDFGVGSRVLTKFGTNTIGLTAGDVYYFGSSVWSPADADAASTASGMLAVASDTSSQLGMVKEGLVKMADNTGFSSASAGDVLYLDTTAGHVTTTAPSQNGDIVRVVGYVYDATNKIIYFDPDKTWLEL